MGRRRIEHICACGCGQIVPCRIDPRTGKNSGQCPSQGNYYVAGHGRKITGQKTKARFKELGHPKQKPVGSTFIYNGYVHEKVADGIWPAQHRLRMGVTDPKLHVHHENEDTTDNSLGNLKVLTPSEHKLLHIARRAQRWGPTVNQCQACGTTERKHGAKGMCVRCYVRQRLGCRPKIGCWSMDNPRCVSCGTDQTKHKGHGMCRTCYNREWFENRKAA